MRENHRTDNANTLVKSKIGQKTHIMVETPLFQKLEFPEKSSSRGDILDTIL